MLNLNGSFMSSNLRHCLSRTFVSRGYVRGSSLGVVVPARRGPNSHESADHRILPRRQFLWDLGPAFGGVALASLLERDGSLAPKLSRPRPADLVWSGGAASSGHAGEVVHFPVHAFGGPAGGPFRLRRSCRSATGRRWTTSSAAAPAPAAVLRPVGHLPAMRRIGLWCSTPFRTSRRTWTSCGHPIALQRFLCPRQRCVLQMNSGRILQGIRPRGLARLAGWEPAMRTFRPMW